MNPNIALLFLVGGALLIYLEFNAPGTIVPGALGTLMVLLAIFALDLLPIRYTAVLLLVAAMVLLILEAKVGGHGALAIAGILCLTFGTLTLVAAPVPEMGVSPLVAISVSVAFGGITCVPGAPGGAGAQAQGADRRRRHGGCNGDGHGGARSGGTRAGGRRDLAGGGGCAGGGGDCAARGGARADAAAGGAGEKRRSESQELACSCGVRVCAIAGIKFKSGEPRSANGA